MKIFISNLGSHVESADLKSFFLPFGSVTSSKVITDKETGKSLRYGFIDMDDENGGREAISKLNGRVVEGRSMRVTLATQKDNVKTDRFF